MKAGRFVSTLALVWVCLAAACASVAAAPGDLDRFFGSEGIVDLGELPDGPARVVDMAVGPDDSIYVLRHRLTCPYGSCTARLLLSHHKPDGSLDRSFGSNGVGAMPSTQSISIGQGSIAVGADGKVVIATIDLGDLMIARFNQGGIPDTSFGIDGLTHAALGMHIGSVKAAIARDGKIVVAAESSPNYGAPTVVVARYTQQGSPDPAFNGGSPVFTSLSSGFGDLGLTGAGAAFLAGPSCCGGGNAVHIDRLDSTGSFDRHFGIRGRRFVDDVVKRPRVGAVVPLSRGRVYVVGTGKEQTVFALRLLPGGRLDPSFGHRGIAYVRQAALSVAGAAVDRHGRLVVGGVISVLTRYEDERDLAVLRLLPNGRRDFHFAGGRPIRWSFHGDTALAAIGLQSRGQIVAAILAGLCERSCSEPESMLIRFLGGPGPARCAGRKATIVGTRRGEKLTGTSHRDVIAALGGDDVVNGRGGNDLICGGRGNDRLRGGPGRDRLFGGMGRDHRDQ